MADPDERSRQLAAESLAADDPTGWFERLYAAAKQGDAVVPWDRGAPHHMLVDWAETTKPDGVGQTAMVVGCGLGEDAEYVAKLGFDTTAFDLSETAIELVRQGFPDSPVRYLAADLLDPPAEWTAAFDFVFESLTVQSLPVSLHEQAIAEVARMVAPGGRLLVIAARRDEADGQPDGPPWPLTEAEIDAFTSDGLRPVRIEPLRDPIQPAIQRWRAEFTRPAQGQLASPSHTP